MTVDIAADNCGPVTIGTPAIMLTPREVTVFLGRTLATLARWRKDGTGPRWTKVGSRLAYYADGLEKWVLDPSRPEPVSDAQWRRVRGILVPSSRVYAAQDARLRATFDALLIGIHTGKALPLPDQETQVLIWYRRGVLMDAVNFIMPDARLFKAIQVGRLALKDLPIELNPFRR